MNEKNRESKVLEQQQRFNDMIKNSNSKKSNKYLERLSNRLHYQGELKNQRLQKLQEDSVKDLFKPRLSHDFRDEHLNHHKALQGSSNKKAAKLPPKSGSKRRFASPSRKKSKPLRGTQSARSFKRRSSQLHFTSTGKKVHHYDRAPPKAFEHPQTKSIKKQHEKVLNELLVEDAEDLPQQQSNIQEFKQQDFQYDNDLEEITGLKYENIPEKEAQRDNPPQEKEEVPFEEKLDTLRKSYKRRSSYNRELSQKLDNLVFRKKPIKQCSQSRKTCSRSKISNSKISKKSKQFGSQKKSNNNEVKAEFLEKKNEISQISHHLDLEDVSHISGLQDIEKAEKDNETKLKSKYSKKSKHKNPKNSHIKKGHMKLRLSFAKPQKKSKNSNSKKKSVQKPTKTNSGKPIKEEMASEHSNVYTHSQPKSSRRTTKMLERTDSLAKQASNSRSKSRRRVRQEDSLENTQFSLSLLQDEYLGNINDKNLEEIAEQKKRRVRAKKRRVKNHNSVKKEILGKLKELYKDVNELNIEE